MDAEYKFDLMLEKFWAKGLIEDTSNKAQKVFYFNMIKKEFKEWLIETKECSEDNFYDKITEDNYLQFRKWQIAKTEADTKKLEIVMELCGKNNSLSKVIQVDHINPALNKYKLAPLEAIDLIEDIGKKAYSPSFYNKVASAIIEHLERIMARPKINTNADEVKEDKAQSKELDNLYKRIFVNTCAIELFNSLKEGVREKNKLADYSFIFRRMQKDSLIYKDIKEKEFRESIIPEEELDKLKGLVYCKTNFKESNYNLKKATIKGLSIKK